MTRLAQVERAAKAGQALLRLVVDVQEAAADERLDAVGRERRGPSGLPLVFGYQGPSEPSESFSTSRWPGLAQETRLP